MVNKVIYYGETGVMDFGVYTARSRKG